MANKFRVNNPDLSFEEQTFLDADFLSGTTLTVRNNENFLADYFVVIGEPSHEQTELRTIQSLSGATSIIVTTAPSFSHPKSTPLYQCQWNKVSVERKSGSGSYSEIASSPFLLDWSDEDNSTLINDPSGDSSSIYRWRFFNDTTSTYSSYSGELSASGLSRDQAGFVIQKVRRNKQLTEGVSDEDMYDYMNDFHDVIREQIPDAWWFEEQGTPVSTTPDQYTFSISDNWPSLSTINYMLYRYVNGSIDETYPLTYTTRIEFYNAKRDSDQTTDDLVGEWTLLPKDANSDLGYIGIHPTPRTDDCYLIPVYNKELTDISSFSDTLLIPKPKAYEDYILYRIAHDIKGDTVKAAEYNANTASNISALKKLAKRQVGQKDFLKFRGQKGYSRLFRGIGYARPVDDRVNYW
jgi:hypothetical protein